MVTLNQNNKVLAYKISGITQKLLKSWTEHRRTKDIKIYVKI